MLRRSALAGLIAVTACGQDLTRPDESTELAALRPGQRTTFLPLPVDDAEWSMAYGVSETGWAAGEIDLSDTDWHAARWRIATPGGAPASAVLEDLGRMNGRATIAFDVNLRGDVVGGSLEAASGIGAGPDEAFVYRGGQMRALPTLGGANAFARRINNFGWIAGQSETAAGELHATVWRPRSTGGYTAIDLGTLGGTFSWCNTIDDFGRVVGLSETAGGSITAWVWDGHGPLRPLPSLTSGGDNFAIDLNLLGVIVGTATAEDGNFHATRWVRGGVQDLHGRFPDFESSFARGVNLANDVVVSAFDQDFNSGGFLLRHSGAVDLSAAAGTPSSDVFDINTRGWVAGGAGEAGIFTAGTWIPDGPGGAHLTQPQGVAAGRHSASPALARAHAQLWRTLRLR